MMSMLKVLIVLTSHAVLGSTGQPTGVWLEELSTPYYRFVDAGVEVDIVSIDGGKVPIDPHSERSGKNPPSVERFLHDKAAMAKIEHSKRIDAVRAAGYSAIFLAGGHGTMWDFPDNKALTGLLNTAWADGKVVSAVCHGPSGLVNVTDESGKPLVAGRKVSAFTDDEEIAAGNEKIVPFALETRLHSLGADFQKGAKFQPFAVRDGRLITGQNPASSEKVADLVLAAIKP